MVQGLSYNIIQWIFTNHKTIYNIICDEFLIIKLIPSDVLYFDIIALFMTTAKMSRDNPSLLV